MSKGILNIATIKPKKPSINRRDFLKLAGLSMGAAGLYACSPGGSGDEAELTGPVDTLVFGGYNDQDIARTFEEKYGIKVNHAVFNDNEEAYTKMKAGGMEQYDVLQADSFYFRKYWDEGMIDVLDYADFESAATLYPEFQDVEIWRQDGGYLAYPSMWAPYPIVYNPDYVDPPPDSWSALWDPKYAGRISMLDRPVEAIVATALMLGFENPFALTTEELKAVEEALIEQKPLVRTYWRDVEQLSNIMAGEEVYLSMAFGPGAAAEIRDRGTPCEAVIPKEGSQGWIDGSAIVKGAKNPEAAIKWIDHQYSPEGYIVLSEYMPWGVPNKKAVEMLLEQGKDDYVTSTMSDQPEVISTLYHYRPPNDMKAYQDTWNRVLAADA